MEKRTAEIIMVCKGQHDFGKSLSCKQAIAAYMADRCCTPLNVYTDKVINKVIWKAALDYLDSMKEHRPSVFLRECENVLYCSTSPFADYEAPMDAYDAICGAFAQAAVKDDRGYINGFTEENTRLVCRMRHSNKEQ